MADRAPGRAQAIVQLVHRQYQAGPGRLLALGLQQVRDGAAVIGQDLFDRRLHMFRTDCGERRQIIGLQKRVVRAHG
jgi:hypothetical protein